MKFPNSSLSRSPLRLFVARILLAIVISLVAGLARAQTLYVSSGPGSIDTISATGVVSPFATLPYAATPTSLAFDSAGNLYAADYGSNQIYKITPGGAVSLFATLPFGGDDVIGLAMDGSGNLYATENPPTLSNYSSYVIEINPAGNVSIFDTLPYTLQGLAFDHSGNLYVATFPSLALQISGTTQPNSGVILPGDVPNPWGLAFDASGNLYTVDNGTSQVCKITPGGTLSVLATIPGADRPQGAAINGNGDLFVADTNLNEISEITPNGTLSTFATGINSPTFLTFGPAPVPEPDGSPLLAIGLGALAAWPRHRARGCRAIAA